MSRIAADEFQELVNIMKRLRKECPWDRAQTPQSLRQYILEEAFEVIETIDEENWSELGEELGDLLLQIVFQSEIAEERSHFTISDVIRHINNKMVNRHPHVFGEAQVKSEDDVADNWEHIKIHLEKRKSLLSGVPAAAPALLQAQRLQDKASRVGFDWDDINDVLNKVQEEIEEVRQAMAGGDKDEVNAEFGDLLFALVNSARFLDLNAEDALRMTNQKFIRRFSYIEEHFGQDFNKMKAAGLAELDRLWDKAKQIEREKK
jgi:tetrapyrrole methylase family protein/MazG family protein